MGRSDTMQSIMEGLTFDCAFSTFSTKTNTSRPPYVGDSIITILQVKKLNALTTEILK